MARLGALAAAVVLVASAPASTLTSAGKLLTSPTKAQVVSDSPRVRLSASDFAAGATTSSPADDVAIAPPPETFDAPAAAPAPPPAELRSTALAPEPSGGVWAVVIGIDDYPGSGSDLRASVNDADDVDAALAGYGVPDDHRLVLRNTQASAGTIADSLRWLVARSGSDATAVLFYAGHVRKLGRGSEAIVGADGRVLADVTMAGLLRPLAARRTWIGIAACYAGGFTELLAPGRILTGAADANHLAYENASFGRSYMVEYMVRRAMLQRQAPGSIEQSFAWASAALQNDRPDRVPIQYDEVDGELHLGIPPPTAAPAVAPPPPDDGGDQPPPPSDDPEDPPHKEGCVITVGSLVGCHD